MSDSRPTTLSGKEAAAESRDGSDGELNLAGTLLIVGSVTAVFTAVVVLAFPVSIARLFSLVVASVTIITLIFIGVLQWLGVVSRDVLSPEAARSPEGDDSAEKGMLPSIEEANKSLPKQVDFTTELETIQEHFDGTFPRQADEFLREYEKFRTQPARRGSIAGTMRSALNPLQALTEEGSDASEAVDEIGDRLFEYISRSPEEQLEVTDYWLEIDGEEAALSEVAGEDAQLHVELHNRGEPLTAALEVVFRDGDSRAKHRAVQHPVDELSSEEKRTVEFRVVAPETAGSVDVLVSTATVRP